MKSPQNVYKIGKNTPIWYLSHMLEGKLPPSTIFSSILGHHIHDPVPVETPTENIWYSRTIEQVMWA